MMTGRTFKTASLGRRGFSFVEILFAIAVLGIGFIMLAAIFPVGLQQTKMTIDETIAAANARGVVSEITKMAEAQVQYNNLNPADVTSPLPVTLAAPANPNPLPPAGQSVLIRGQVRSFRDPRLFSSSPPTAGNGAMHGFAADSSGVVWERLSSHLINSSDPRNGCVLFYKRDAIYKDGQITGAKTAQVIAINTQVAAASEYVTADAIVRNTATPYHPVIYNLEPRPVCVTITWDNTDGVYLANFYSVDGQASTTEGGVVYPSANKDEYNAAPAAVAEGCFVVIADDRVEKPTGTNPDRRGLWNGRIFKIGVRRADLTTPAGALSGPWQLTPESEPTPEPGLDGKFYTTVGVAQKDDLAEIGIDGRSGTIKGQTYDGTDVKVDGPAFAFVVGRGFSTPFVTPPGSVGNPSIYTGPAMDVAVYTTFVPVP